MRPLLFLLALGPWTLHAQMVYVEAGTDDPATLRFAPVFIARNKVRSVSGQAHVKRDNEPMRPRHERVHYRFDPQGALTYGNNSGGRPGTGLDTASVAYRYDTGGHLVERLRNDLNGHYLLRNEVDAEGRPLRETYLRVENLGPDRYQLVPGATTIISDETFTYATVNDTAWRKTFVNDRGLPYREQTFSKDRLGYLRAIRDHYLITGRRGIITFDHDERGRLRTRTERPDLGSTRITEHQWTYDAAGNPLTCDVSLDGKPKKHTEYLYEESTMFLKATLTREQDTGLIHVMKYSVER